MTISDISGIRDIKVSIASRGTSMTRVSMTVRMDSDQTPPLKNEISPRNCVGPSVKGK